MPLVLRRPQPRQLPAAGVKIDTAHPLANGLIGCYVPGISGGVNLVGIGADLTPTLATNDITQDGPALALTTSTSHLSALALAPFIGWTTGFSLFWRGRTDPASNPFDYATLIGVSYSDPSGSPFSVATLHRRSLSTNIRAQTNSAGTVVDTADWSIALGSTFSAGASFTVGGNAVLYGNGLSQGSAAMASAPNSTATSTIGFGVGVFGSPYNSFSLPNVGYIWNRALSADEHALLDADPYGFLIPAEGEWPVMFSVVTPVNAPAVPAGLMMMMGVGG